jgi:hypothetical protein
MTQKQALRRMLLAALWLLGIGGWLMHLAIHPISEGGSNFIPFFSGALSVLLVPLLFSFKRTVAFAYVLNGMAAVLGTITMAADSLKQLPVPLTLGALLLGTLLPDILLLWGKFAVGYGLFELELVRNEEQAHRQGRFWRYPNLGFWWVHLAAWSVVFYLGQVLWR